MNWDEAGKDYLENFVPFLVEVLRASNDNVVSLPAATTLLAELVGFEIPQGVVKMLLRRAARHHYVRAQNRLFYVQRDALPSEPLAKRENDLRREFDALVMKLQDFARERFKLSWSGPEAEHALLGVIESFAAPLLHSTRKGDRPTAPVGDDQKDLYVAATFVEHAYDRDPSSFAYLENVATGAVLASAVYHEEPSAVVERFEGVAAYLDTPLVLDALGVNGEQVRAPLEEMLALLREQGVSVKILKETFFETQGVLDAHGDRTGDRRQEIGSGPIRGVMSPSDARLLSDRLESRLADLAMRVVERPAFDPRFSINESELDRRLQDAINYVNPAARAHDAQALAAVYALRRGHRPGRLEKSTAFFVTTNGTLARACHNFFREQHGKETSGAPVCMTADDLTTRLWLKTPNKAPNLPTRQLLARAYAALQPSDALMAKYLAETDRLRRAGTVSERDYLTLRCSNDLLRRVTEATLNDPEAFTEGTLDELRAREFETLRAAAASRAERAEAARREAELRAEVLNDTVKAAAESGQRLAADLEEERRRREASDTEREALLARSLRQTAIIDRIAAAAGLVVHCGVVFSAASTLLLGALLSFPGLTQWLGGGVGYVAALGISSFFLVSVVGVFGTATRIGKMPGDWTRRVVRRRLRAILSVDGNVASK